MLVTFGREATTELRERVRARLLAAQRALADPAAARGGGRRGARAARRRARRRGRAAPGAARRARSPRSTPRRSPPPTSSASRCWPGSGVAADADPDAVFVESVEDLLAEVVDDFYVRKYGDRARGTAAVRPRGGAASWPGPRSTTGRPGWSRRAAEPGSVAAHPLPVRRGRARRGGAAQAGAARLHLRRHAHPPRRRAAPTPPRRRGAGCGRATGWCWSTSSRTPTRCSGRSCAAPSTATPRWC